MYAKWKYKLLRSTSRLLGSWKITVKQIKNFLWQYISTVVSVCVCVWGGGGGGGGGLGGGGGGWRGLGVGWYKSTAPWISGQHSTPDGGYCVTWMSKHRLVLRLLLTIHNLQIMVKYNDSYHMHLIVTKFASVTASLIIVMNPPLTYLS